MDRSDLAVIGSGGAGSTATAEAIARGARVALAERWKVGGHVLEARGGELLGKIALAMRTGLRVSALSDTIHAYPTFSEGVFWAAYELAKPGDPALNVARGVSASAGDVPEEV